ncbi:uncharacterized protein [Diadema antillarum]|uniref:uncharacterized protein n=1 Tax=Diadema antillarum TaxID=105358 RepID=UPI003A857AA6
MESLISCVFRSNIVHLVRPAAWIASHRSLSVGLMHQANKTSGDSGEKPAAAPKGTKPAKPAEPAAQATPASKGDSYQTQEYYGYNEMSFYDLESDMRKSRLPQPTPGKP